MFKKSWFNYIAAYLMWVVSIVLGLVFLLLGRLSIPILITASMDLTEFATSHVAGLMDRVFILTAGVLWLILMVLAEHYFRTGAGSGRLWPRVSRLIGIQLLLVFVAHLCYVIVIGLQLTPWLHWLLLIGELALGIFLIFHSIRWNAKHPRPEPGFITD